MEARALARLGDAKACDRELAEAVREFERRKPEDDPGWFQYFDEAELSAEFGHCLRDLRRTADAVRYAGQSAGTAGDGTFARSDFFAAGELERACSTALAALTAGEQIRSGRCVNYLQEFREHLARTGDTTVVRDFNEQAFSSRLWRIAARPDRSGAVA